jgi:hypothetical protein
MDRLDSYPADDHADRVNVFYFKERDQLEVTNRSEGE